MDNSYQQPQATPQPETPQPPASPAPVSPEKPSGGSSFLLPKPSSSAGQANKLAWGTLAVAAVATLLRISLNLGTALLAPLSLISQYSRFGGGPDSTLNTLEIIFSLLVMLVVAGAGVMFAALYMASDGRAKQVARGGVVFAALLIIGWFLSAFTFMLLVSIASSADFALILIGAQCLNLVANCLLCAGMLTCAVLALRDQGRN
ncbi:hypothetical protein ACUH94_06085 [Dermabacteraceae bacterium P7074]